MTAIVAAFILLISCGTSALAQDVDSSSRDRSAEIERGAKTARNGFRNEDQILDKFNAWQRDSESQRWLKAMGYQLSEIDSVSVTKPYGEKADIEVHIKTKAGPQMERISIKLVSNPRGFNQIDKRWLAAYAMKWNMPADVQKSLKLFLGEVPPWKSSRNSERMFLDELSTGDQAAVINFFSEHRERIVSDLFAGDGEHAADWILITLRATDQPKWGLWSISDAVRFYAEGDVVITRAGSLRIGRITMQRKGGDNGRPTAKMLQFKINPAELFEQSERHRDEHPEVMPP